MKKVSIYWALVVGVLAPLAQIVLAYVRFCKMVEGASFLDFVWFFAAGTLGGWILVYFLNRQSSNSKRWVVIVAFLLASPVAVFMMLGGGLLGPIGIIVFPQIPWGVVTWLGSLVAGWVIKS